MINRLFGGCALLACIGLAQDSHRRPGLWEISLTSQTAGMAIPEDRLAKLTPEQRAAFQSAMASRMGGSQPMISKTCETPGTLNTEDSFGQHNTASCKLTPISSSGSKRVMQMNCETAKAKTVSTISIETSDPEHFSGTVVGQINSQGHSIESKQTITGKWVSSDCGDVKPRVSPK